VRPRSCEALRALVDLREEVRGLIDLQLVAFPQQGILGFDGGRELMREAVALGAGRGRRDPRTTS